MNIKKMILKVFSANFIQLISGIIIGFVVPGVLDINGYADLKTYTLYLSYIGLFHLGFIDGLYLKYGGKKIDNVDESELLGEHIFLIIFQIIISIIVLIISILSHNTILLIFSLSILPYMISSFFRYIYQSFGEFGKYSKIMYTYSIVYLLLNILLAFAFKNNNYIYYCITTIIANLASCIYFEYAFISKIKVKPSISRENIKKVFKSGFVLMLGNLAVVLILGIDKWFVKIGLTKTDFAFYSFAVSMLNIINTLVSAVSITFYNYLFKNSQKENLEKLKNTLIIAGSVASSAYFALSIIVQIFLKKYIPSLSIISITFAIFPYLTVITSLINNLYKVKKQENKYLKVVIVVLLLSIIYNFIALVIFKSTISIAIATLITIVTWLLYSSCDIKDIRLSLKDCVYLLVSTLSFLALAHLFDNVFGLIIYILEVLILSLLCYKETIMQYVKRGNKNEE